jgi:hypothetical protein
VRQFVCLCELVVVASIRIFDGQNISSRFCIPLQTINACLCEYPPAYWLLSSGISGKVIASFPRNAFGVICSSVLFILFSHFLIDAHIYDSSALGLCSCFI